MKRLLLLLFLFPFVLFGQTRRQAVVDSIKAANNLRNIQNVINNNRGTSVQDIHASDSGEYVTLLVRVHVPQPHVVPALSFLPITQMDATPAVTTLITAVSIPPLPTVIAYIDSIPPLRSFAALRPGSERLPVTTSNGNATIPPLPHVLSYLIDPAQPSDFVSFHIAGVVAPAPRSTTIPRLPDVESWVIDPIYSFCDAIPFRIKHRPAPRPDTAIVPTFREERFEVEGMHLSEEGYVLLEKMEGFSPDLYNLGDGGYTIGFGFFIPYSEGRKYDGGITIEQAEALIHQKVPAYEDQVKLYINTPLTQREFDALVMLAYNLGGFSRATSIVNDINTQAGFDKLQADWNRFIHSKAPGVTKGLMNRRRDELKVRNESDYQQDRKMQVLRFGRK